MPIYVWSCSDGHQIEKIMPYSEAEQTPSVPCVKGCTKRAKRVEFSTFSPHFAPGGAGGFHKPNTAKIVGRADVTKHINNVTGGKGLHGLVKGGSTARIGG